MRMNRASVVFALKLTSDGTGSGQWPVVALSALMGAAPVYKQANHVAWIAIGQFESLLSPLR